MTYFESVVEKAKNLPRLFSLENKKALVVGGSKGLGQAMALGLAMYGADVCIAARGKDELEQTCAGLRQLGRKAMYTVTDVTDEASVEEMVAKTVEGLGGLDILINSQGLAILDPLPTIDMAKWQKVMDVNVKSLVLTCKYAARVMLPKKYGKIINISSLRAFQGRLNDFAYAPSKGAVNQLTHSLAIELSPQGINVNAIAPAFIKTEMSMDFMKDPEKAAWVLSRSTMKHLGDIEDMMGPAVFLASDASKFVNGHVLMVDGGWLIA